MAPEHLDPALWRGFKVDVLYTRHEDGSVHPSTLSQARDVYNPIDDVPVVIYDRISESTKRLENGLDAKVVASGAWGKVCEVVGTGSATIGVVIVVDRSAFITAHCMPDIAHLTCLSDRLQDGAVMKPLHAIKTFRSFLLGPPNNEKVPHDLVVTTKQRWFRRRNDPKFLGFSKDNK